MPDGQPKPSPLQRLILAALKAKGMSRYRLAINCGLFPHAIYRTLERPTLTTNIEKILAELGATITIQDGPTLSMWRGRDGKVKGHVNKNKEAPDGTAGV